MDGKMKISEQRRKILVDGDIQLRYVLNLSLVASLEMVALAMLITAVLLSTIEVNAEGHWVLFSRIIITVGLALVAFNVFNVIWGLYRSHRLAGPVHRLRQALIQMGAGNFEGVLQLRQEDELQPLKEELNRTLEQLRKAAQRKQAQQGRLQSNVLEIVATFEKTMPPELRQRLLELEEKIQFATDRP